MARAAPKRPDAGAAAAPDTPERSTQRLRAPITVVALLGLAGLGIYDKAIFTFVLAGLLPSGVAWLFDRSPTMVLSRTVIPLNISTLMPCIFQIYYSDDEGQKISTIMSNMWTWIMVYSSSGFGFLLYYFLPPIIGIYISAQTEKRRKNLLKIQEELKEEWGSEVGG